ncbi:VOC family protein [Aureisphaera sp. CAU 1614]|uniref:VOC family protein n=1 Tax=Halomarinibacterium sedimenti TaxID=2857106 RepID=A0A9X1FLP7_9FLAO|nr:VOC family protein [Halomarinibacterium sedimenti]MBW2936759.1 VOC family protein [Halomarinibacterium sedimenti]
MKIKKLQLLTNNLKDTKEFYTVSLGLQTIEESSDKFTLQIGRSELTFLKAQNNHIYHFCFLIPSNKIIEALEWFEKRGRVLSIENQRKIQNFESWNAQSFYFKDPSGNIVEFIVRHDIENKSDVAFGSDSILCVNEIGMPTRDILTTNRFLESKLTSKFWKGNFKSFGTHGSQIGLLLLPNYLLKAKWFPTELVIKPEPFKAQLEINEILYSLEYKNETISISIL